MTRKLNTLSEQHMTVLKNYLKQGPRASLQPVRGLGRQALAIGLETLDLARIRKEARKKSGGYSKRLLEESRRLQRHLQHLTHQILSAQEDKRRKISRDLRDEIAQTLLGINVRLLTLRKEATVNAESLKNDVASTQRLVDKSLQSINRFAREFGKHRQT